MIGLSTRDILACLGEPVRRRAVAQATEIWTYPVGYTTTDTPPWAPGSISPSAQPSLPATSSW